MDPLNVLGAAVEILKCTCGPVVRKINYRRKLRENFNTLSRKNTQLIAREKDIRSMIDRAQAESKVTTERALVMLEDVEKTKSQVSDVSRSLEENTSCVFNCCSLFKLSKHVVEAIKEVDRLVDETSQFANELVIEAPPPRAEPLVKPTLVGSLTVTKNLDAILESLRNPDIGKIGVYAMGGSGKTSTVKNIHSKLATTEDFDKIIWVTVSKDLNLYRVQKEIAEQLKLHLSAYEGKERRAGRLSERLKMAKKVLIIFDDMWQRISLEEVGIPEPDIENKCKILLTTRLLGVCNDMETHKNIKLELLSKEEAWELFVTKAGKQVLNPEVQPFAESVVRECGALPLAINTVGRALRNEDEISVWRRAVKDLQSSPTEIRGIEDNVFKLLRFSYTHLKNDVMQKCFLYCALFPEDFNVYIDELIRLWMAENFIEEVDEGSKILKELSDGCMVEKFKYSVSAEFNDSIRMHDCLRDLAIDIMGAESGSLVKAGLGLTKSPNENEWNKAPRISLVRNEIQFLPDHPNCPNLLTLLLQKNPLSQPISCSFFDQMPALKILDLSDTGIKELPSSFSNLINLRALVLKYCAQLEKIPSVAKLQKLGSLDLSRTGIKELPQGMEYLVSLRSLDLTGTRYFPKNWQTRNLPHLGLLLMYKSKIWGMDTTTVSKLLTEIKILNHLDTLDLTIGRLDYLNANSEGYYNVDCDLNMCLPMPAGSRKATVMFHWNLYHQPPICLPPNTHILHMIDSHIPRLSRFLCLRNLKFLEECHISFCKMGDSLISGAEMEEYPFPNLQTLRVEAGRELTVLWTGVVPHGCLANLRKLSITDCESLNSIFSNSIPEIRQGGLLEEILYGSNGEGNEGGSIILPKLEEFLLCKLPQLHTIAQRKLVFVSLRIFSVFECPNLKKVPLNARSLPSLEKIMGATEWWEALEWDDAHTKNLLQPCFKHESRIDEFDTDSGFYVIPNDSPDSAAL